MIYVLYKNEHKGKGSEWGYAMISVIGLLKSIWDVAIKQYVWNSLAW